jgi:hypothetical protein
MLSSFRGHKNLFETRLIVGSRRNYLAITWRSKISSVDYCAS